MWDPDVYLAFADHRSRPFYDLLSRVGAGRARRVVDLGCGPGNLTKYLDEALARVGDRGEWTARRRWSPRPGNAASTPPSATCETGSPKPDTDVVVSNAALHWVPEHADLLVRWAGELAPGSWIAVQIPGNFETPSHAAVRAVARREHVRKGLERHTVSSRCGGAAAGKLRQSAVGRRMQSRRVGDDLSAPADRRAPGAGMDHRHRAGPGARAARRRGMGGVSPGADPAAATTPTRLGPTARRSSRSGGCSSSPKSVQRTRAGW